MLLLLTLLLLPPPEDPPPSWHFLLPAPGAPDEHAPPRALPLSAQKPDDVEELASYRGNSRRYAQVRFGSPSSTRVTVVLDEVTPRESDLYVDADRDRRIEPSDRIDGPGPLWRVPLSVAVARGIEVEYVPRAVVFRRGSTGRTLAVAAAGYLEGTVRLRDQAIPARRVDGDADGSLTGPRDRLLLDTDSDGRYDPATEQFLFAPILRVGPDRLAARSDELGTRLELEPLTGTGSVRLAPADAARFAELSVTLIGRDGSVVGLSGTDSETTVPAGSYRVSTVACSLDDPAGGPRWSFVFSDNGRRGEPAWHEIADGQSLALDPIGDLELTINLDQSTPTSPGDELGLQPALHTGDGLLIVTAYRGTPTSSAIDGGAGAQISLTSADGRPLGSAHSGFA